MSLKSSIVGVVSLFSVLILSACGGSKSPQSSRTPASTEDAYEVEDLELYDSSFVKAFACRKATESQLRLVNQGNAKKAQLLQRCARETGGSQWCAQIIRPNPSSLSAFRCTYGPNQVHQLIHPSESTWGNAIGAIRLVQELEQKGLRVCQIYNWWRPEPYNANVGGAAGRHPGGTSVDVRFCSNADAKRAFTELCKFRKQGRIRAIGHYGTSALHFGIGDRSANTWGRSCP